MVYQTGKLLLQETQELYRGPVNDCVVCRDLTASTQCYYTVIIIKNNEISRRFLEIYRSYGEESRNTLITGFSWKNYYLVVFPYKHERPVNLYADTDIGSLAECEQLAMNVVMECMASHIPYPILYLQLSQQQMHLSKDKQVYFGYKLSLELLDEQVGEQECAGKCADILFELIDRQGGVKNASHKLLQYKTKRREYRRFTELYKDIKAAAAPIEKNSIASNVGGFWKRNRDRFLRFFVVISIILAVMALIMIITQAIFGDIPFMRMFYNPFKMIGTESMLK